ncbi:hypothetical protein [Pararhodobacter marinus]|uniref:hypothetical protein n=1 Tax=Pararhodobacter marinus TaxID=2184063 RepID=UPI0035141401
MAYLFIDVQHGLSNRLRAMASAAVIARASGRELVVVWRPDHHCEARIGDLLDYDGLVIEDSDPDILSRGAARVYNYMEIEEGAQFRAPVDPSDIAGDVYIRSAYTLESPLRNDRDEAAFLRALRPCAAVLELVYGVARPSDVALHVRMATGPAFDHLSYESPANWPPERHQELIEWRQKSDISRFVARLDRLLEERPVDSLFVAADLPATYAALIERYGDRVRHLPRTLYDRSARQLQYGLADVILLSAAPLFLASNWSSFSDLAQRLARPGRRVERSGLDF